MGKTVVFDMDGVIFDTEKLCLSCWVREAGKKGIPNMENVFKMCIGTTNVRTEEIMYENYGHDFLYAEFRKDTSVMYHEWIDENGMPLKPGVVEILDFLRDNGYRIGLASSTRRPVVVDELKKAGIYEYFDVIVGGDQLTKSKPEPDIYLMACEMLGCSPCEAYAVEDSFNGIRSAYSAGMKTIMVPDLIAPDEEMHKKASVICDSLDEARKWLEKREQQ